jgi:signal peptidase I
VKKLLSFIFWVAGTMAVIVLALRLTIMNVWTIPDDNVLDSSMRPSLSAGDVVVLLTVGQRGFGDLVQCTDPEDAQRFVVGRIVGLGGDKVEIANPVVTVNGTHYNRMDSCTQNVITVPDPRSGAPVQAGCNRIDMAGGWHYRANAGSKTESPSSHLVGPGLVYLLSDDRTFHDDSRDFGAIPAESCKGLIFFRLWGKGGFDDESGRFTYIH